MSAKSYTEIADQMNHHFGKNTAKLIKTGLSVAIAKTHNIEPWNTYKPADCFDTIHPNAAPTHYAAIRLLQRANPRRDLMEYETSKERAIELLEVDFVACIILHHFIQR